MSKVFFPTANGFAASIRKMMEEKEEQRRERAREAILAAINEMRDNLEKSLQTGVAPVQTIVSDEITQADIMEAEKDGWEIFMDDKEAWCITFSKQICESFDIQYCK